MTSNRTIVARYDGRCSLCEGEFKRGARIIYSRQFGPRHLSCKPGHPVPGPDPVDLAYEDMCRDMCGPGL